MVWSSVSNILTGYRTSDYGLTIIGSALLGSCMYLTQMLLLFFCQNTFYSDLINANFLVRGNYNSDGKINYNSDLWHQCLYCDKYIVKYSIKGNIYGVPVSWNRVCKVLFSVVVIRLIVFAINQDLSSDF